MVSAQILDAELNSRKRSLVYPKFTILMSDVVPVGFSGRENPDNPNASVFCPHCKKKCSVGPRHNHGKEYYARRKQEAQEFSKSTKEVKIDWDHRGRPNKLQVRKPLDESLLWNMSGLQ